MTNPALDAFEKLFTELGCLAKTTDYNSDAGKFLIEHRETIRTALANAPEVVTANHLAARIRSGGWKDCEDLPRALAEKYPNGLRIVKGGV